MPKALLLQVVLISLQIKELSNRVILAVRSFHQSNSFFINLQILCLWVCYVETNLKIKDCNTRIFPLK